MALPKDPISGGYRLTNDNREDYWTCPNCYADHEGYSLADTTITCKCGATLSLTVERMPTCVATCIDEADGEDDG